MIRTIDTNFEPKFLSELSRVDLFLTLNWYAQNKDAKDAYKWASNYLNKKLKLKINEESIKSQTVTFGWACRITDNGGTLPLENIPWFNKTIEKLKTENFVVIEKPVISNVPVVSIQDRIKESTSKIIAELEALIDTFVGNECKESSKSPKGMMIDMKVKSVHTKEIVEHFKKMRQEIDEVLEGNDEQLNEAYAYMKKTGQKRFHAFLSRIIDEALLLGEDSKKNRKPPKRKAKSPDQLVAKLKYCIEDIASKLKSIDPRTIIGVSALWVYNIKTRKLGCYYAEDISGLSVKGTVIQNFVETKSVQKKLRKPEVVLPEVINGGKVILKNILTNIRAVENNLTGRINCDTILVRVIK
jgi:hypothetical protein